MHIAQLRFFNNYYIYLTLTAGKWHRIILEMCKNIGTGVFYMRESSKRICVVQKDGFVG
jgi:hypothetical protein